jgi:hypothetical protein
MPLEPSDKHHTLNAIGSATPTKLLAFAHAALLLPALSSLENAPKKGYINNLPDLTTPKQHCANILPNPLTSMSKATLIRPNRSNTALNSRHPPTRTLTPSHFPLLMGVVTTAMPLTFVIEPTSQIYTDQTRKYVQVSSNGNNYLLILYDYDNNCIFAKPLKT